MQLAAAAQAAQGLASLNNFPMNLPYGFPTSGGYSTTPTPAGVNPQTPNPNSEQFPGASNLNSTRFSGPTGRGSSQRRDNRGGGRPNRWDDRGNYDDRRRDEFRREGDRNRNNNNDSRGEQRDRGRSGFGSRDGRGGGRDGEFHRRDRNRAGKYEKVKEHENHNYWSGLFTILLNKIFILYPRNATNRAMQILPARTLQSRRGL